jgi:hypothetical protein
MKSGTITTIGLGERIETAQRRRFPQQVASGIERDSSRLNGSKHRVESVQAAKMKREHWYFTIIAAGALAVVVLIYRSIGRGPAAPLPPEKAAETANHATSEREVYEALTSFGRVRRDDAPQVRAIMTNPHNETRVRAAAADALGEIADWEAIPQLLEAMNDPDPIVRGRAGVAAQKIVGADYHFRAEAPEEERREIMGLIWQYWESRRN